MSEPASISAGIAERYATAIFELAQEGDWVPTLETDLGIIDGALSESGELRELIGSPVISRDAQGAAITRIASQAGVSQMTTNTLALMAGQRRLFVLPQLISALRKMISDFKGEITAEVTTAAFLTDAQIGSLTDILRAKTGKSISLNVTVDNSLIGGMIVKVGSQMIDTSIASKLANLQNSMKEVG